MTAIEPADQIRTNDRVTRDIPIPLSATHSVWALFVGQTEIHLQAIPSTAFARHRFFWIFNQPLPRS